MPSPADDRFFGGPGSSKKVYAALVKQYGAAKAEQVYQALKNRQKQRAGGKGQGLRAKLAEREKGRKKSKQKRGRQQQEQRGNPFA